MTIRGKQPNRRSSLLAAGAAALLLLPTASLLAQGDGKLATQSERTYSFNIQSQPLPQAIAEFSAVTGRQVLYTETAAFDVTAPALQGRLTADQALHRLVAGSGLDYRYTSANTVTLVGAGAQESDGSIQLGPITVEGWRPTRTRGYSPGVISSATKTPTSIQNIPNSVSVVTTDVIDDQNATSVREALRNVPGVQSGPNPANVSVQEEVTIRGFESALVHVNGVERRSTGPLSTANIESVEVLKGPFSVLYGRLSPGGMVNIQTKRPQRNAAYMAQGGFSQVTEGRGTKGRGVVDATGPITEDGSFLYRIVGSASGGTSFIEEVTEEQYLFNPSASFIGADNALRIDADLSYLRNEGTFLFGIPALGDGPDTRIDYDAFLGASDSKKTTEDYTAELRTQYNITEDTNIDGALTYHRNDISFVALRPSFDLAGQQVAVDDTVKRNYEKRGFRTQDIEFELNGTHEFDAGPTDWRLLAGGDVRRTKLEDSEQRKRIFDFDTVNVLNPDNNVTLPSDNDPRISLSPLIENIVDSYGFYIQAETWLYDRVKLLGGVRYDYVDYTFENDAGFFFQQEDEAFSPRGGILVKVTPDTSVYGSYTSSFEQSLSFDPDAEPFEPTEGEQWEVGVKQDFFGGDLLATVSLFQLTQSNIVQSDSTQVGEAETLGFEVELNGRLTDDLRVIAGYTYLDNEITEATDGTEGNRLVNTPDHAASAFLMYDAYKMEKERFSIGGGVFYTGETFTSTNNSITLPDYVTVDLTGEYAFKAGGFDLEVKGAIKNVFDEEYYYGGFGASATGSGIAFRGEPRSVFVNVTARF